MKSWVPPVILLTLAGVGFTVVAIKTRSAKPAKTVGGIKYRVGVYQGDGGYYSQTFVDGKPGELIGPVPTPEDASDQGAAYIAGLTQVAFYTLYAKASGTSNLWYFDGWSRGTKVTSGNGPYGSEPAAATAGSLWIAGQSAGEVVA